MYKYRFYQIETRHNNKLLSMAEFYKQLELILNKKENQTFGVGIGALSADNRNDWANVS